MTDPDDETPEHVWTCPRHGAHFGPHCPTCHGTPHDPDDHGGTPHDPKDIMQEHHNIYLSHYHAGLTGRTIDVPKPGTGASPTLGAIALGTYHGARRWPPMSQTALKQALRAMGVLDDEEPADAKGGR